MQILRHADEYVLFRLSDGVDVKVYRDAILLREFSVGSVSEVQIPSGAKVTEWRLPF